jgi:hypothetical protein
VFGEIVHLQGGYQHDLREVKFNDGKVPMEMVLSLAKKVFQKHSGAPIIQCTAMGICIRHMA